MSPADRAFSAFHRRGIMKPLLALQIRNALKQNKWLPQNVETIDYKHAHQPDSVKSLEKEYLPYH